MAATDLSLTRPAVNVAMIQAWTGADAAVRASLADAYGIAAPSGPRAVSRAGMTLVGYGPESWLLVEAAPKANWEKRLQTTLGAQAAVSDQTGAYVLHHISGPHAALILSKGAFLDLDPAIFAIGHAANTVIAHVGVTLWRSGEQAFEILVPRSFAGAFDHWFSVAAGGLSG